MAVTSNIVQVGNSVRVDIVVKDAAGTATDPVSITARLLMPDGTEDTAPTVTDQAGTGNYRCEFTVDDAPGTWYLRIQTSTPTAAVEIPIVAAASRFEAPW